MAVQSKRFQLNSYDWKSLAIGVAITATGAALTYISEWFSGQDWGDYAPIVMTLMAFLVNFIRKWISGKK
jgi:hypothetical protein